MIGLFFTAKYFEKIRVHDGAVTHTQRSTFNIKCDYFFVYKTTPDSCCRVKFVGPISQIPTDPPTIADRRRIVRRGTVEQVVAGHPATIRAIIPADVTDLPEIHGSSTRDRQGRLQITTDHLEKDLLALLTWSREHGVDLSGLDARAASLESVFLEIAGSGITAGDAPAIPTA